MNIMMQQKIVCVSPNQGSRFCTVLASTASIYRTGKQTGIYNPPVSYWKKYRPYRPISGNTGRYRIFFFFFLSFVIFEVLLWQNSNLIVLTY